MQGLRVHSTDRRMDFPETSSPCWPSVPVLPKVGQGLAEDCKTMQAENTL